MGKRKKVDVLPPAVPPSSGPWARLRLSISLLAGAIITIAAVAASEYRWTTRREAALMPVGVNIRKIDVAAVPPKGPKAPIEPTYDESGFNEFWKRFRAVDDLSLATAAWKRQAEYIAKHIEGEHDAFVLVEQVKAPRLPPVHRFIVVRANNPAELTEQLEQLNVADVKPPTDERTYYIVSPNSAPQWQSYDAQFEERMRLLREVDDAIAKKRAELRQLEEPSAPSGTAPASDAVASPPTVNDVKIAPRVILASAASTTDGSLASWWAEFRLPIIVGLLYYLVILLGIEAGSLYEIMSHRKPNTRLRLRDVIGYTLTVQHWQGVLVSPLIFGIFYVGIAGDGLRTSFLVFALQNGFFWRTLMKRLQPRVEMAKELQAA